LLHLASDCYSPTSGEIRVLGRPPEDDLVPQIGFVAQDAPLYRDFTARELITMCTMTSRRMIGTLCNRFTLEGG
jgi:ABC-2 type transport system ATP-binding protein